MEYALKHAKSLAKTLLKEAKSGNANVLKRLKKYYRLDENHPTELKLKMCQHLVAKDAGLFDWQQLHQLLSAEVADNTGQTNFGSVLHSSACDRFLNKWFASYQEAQQALTKHSYLVPFKHQFMVVKGHYFAEIGISNMPELSEFNNDLVKAYPSETWDKLVAQVFAAKRSKLKQTANQT